MSDVPGASGTAWRGLLETSTVKISIRSSMLRRVCKRGWKALDVHPFLARLVRLQTVRVASLIGGQPYRSVPSHLMSLLLLNRRTANILTDAVA